MSHSKHKFWTFCVHTRSRQQQVGITIHHSKAPGPLSSKSCQLIQFFVLKLVIGINDFKVFSNMSKGTLGSMALQLLLKEDSSFGVPCIWIYCMRIVLTIHTKISSGPKKVAKKQTDGLLTGLNRHFGGAFLHGFLTTRNNHLDQKNGLRIHVYSLYACYG